MKTGSKIFRDSEQQLAFVRLGEIFKFCDFKKTLLNFAKSIIAHIFAKFKYFEKQTIYCDSSDHVLQNDIQRV